MNRRVGRVRPGEPPRNVFNNVGLLGQTRPTWFGGSKHDLGSVNSLPPILSRDPIGRDAERIRRKDEKRLQVHGLSERPYHYSDTRTGS